MVMSVLSCGLEGIQGRIITVEVDMMGGAPSHDIVGLPDKAVTESRERIRVAIRNSHIDLPPARVVVNLAPADCKKVGTVFDLPIAVCLIATHNKIPKQSLQSSMFVGELALDGAIRPVQGVISMVKTAKQNGIKRIFVPAFNAQEGAYVSGVDVISCDCLRDVVQMLNGQAPMAATQPLPWEPTFDSSLNDFALVRGQYLAKRACEIAAAGGHNMLLIGPPGGGKTFISRAMPTILPDLSFDEALEISAIHSASGVLEGKIVRSRPFCAPHHSASAASIIGGGANALPGEISMAHLGVLFLDELAEFGRIVLEALRQPLEDGVVTVARVNATSTYPARFMFIGAMNPCPCGNFGSRKRVCTCAEHRISSYRRRLSGPLLDRIDVFVEMEDTNYEDLHGTDNRAEPSEAIRARVNAARMLQLRRFGNAKQFCNAHMGQADIQAHCILEPDAQKLYKQAFIEKNFNARSNARTLRLARTIADLDESKTIQQAHIAEALQYRSFEKYWG